MPSKFFDFRNSSITVKAVAELFSFLKQISLDDILILIGSVLIYHGLYLRFGRWAADLSVGVMLFGAGVWSSIVHPPKNSSNRNN